MDKKGTYRIQDAMGEHMEVKRIHTREMSQLFKSKKEIYTVLMSEGQLYLPPFEDCTIDYMRDIFNGRKKVRSISSHFDVSTYTTVKCQL
jgi:hypothetical protein